MQNNIGEFTCVDVFSCLHRIFLSSVMVVLVFVLLVSVLLLLVLWREIGGRGREWRGYYCGHGQSRGVAERRSWVVSVQTTSLNPPWCPVYGRENR